MLLGLDIGFGDIKGVYAEGVFRMPTAVAHAKSGLLELGEFAGSEEEFVFGGKAYHLGEKALEKALSTRSFDFLKKYAPLLAYKAVKDSGRKVSRLAVGLPLAWYTPQNRKFFTSALKKFEVNGETISLEQVDVYPQGVGILMDYRFGLDGKEQPGTTIDGLVVDIGFNTVDVVAFSNGSAVRSDSAMFERAGVSRIAQDLIQALQAECGINLSEQEAKKALLEGKTRVYGAEKDLAVTIEAIAEDYVEWLLDLLASRWEDKLQRSGKLIIAGGGAHFLARAVPQRYAAIVHVPGMPEFANARGFYKASLAKDS